MPGLRRNIVPMRDTSPALFFLIQVTQIPMPEPLNITKQQVITQVNPDDGWDPKLWSVYTALQNQGLCEIARVWNTDAQSIAGSIRVQEKSIQDMDEDTATIAVETARNAVNRAEIEGTYSFTTDTPDFWRREGMPRARYGTFIMTAGEIFRGDLNSDGKIILEEC